MCNGTCVVCLESSQDFKGRRDDSDAAIVASKEQALRTRADAAYFVTVEERFALVVGRLDLADLEEIERLPLRVIAKLVYTLRLKPGIASA